MDLKDGVEHFHKLRHVAERYTPTERTQEAKGVQHAVEGT